MIPEIQSRTKAPIKYIHLLSRSKINCRRWPIGCSVKCELECYRFFSPTKSIWYTSYTANYTHFILFALMKKNIAQKEEKPICKWLVSFNDLIVSVKKPIHKYIRIQWMTHKWWNSIRNWMPEIVLWIQNAKIQHIRISFVVIWVITSRKLKCWHEEKYDRALS